MIAEVAHRNVVRILREMMQPDGESLCRKIRRQVGRGVKDLAQSGTGIVATSELLSDH
jgi:hypothetical protein